MANTPVTQDSGSGDDAGGGKGRATPTRREREAANKRPLVGDASSAAAKARQRASADRARAGMAAGDEKYLPERDKGPQRRYVRDYVDARWSIAELLLPLLLVFLGLSLFEAPWVQQYSFFAMWGFTLLTVTEMIVLGLVLRRKLTQKFGKENLQRGYGWYAALRAMQLRFLRMPNPQVKRGQFPK